MTCWGHKNICPEDKAALYLNCDKHIYQSAHKYEEKYFSTNNTECLIKHGTNVNMKASSYTY